MPFQFRKEAIEEDLNTNFPSQGQGNPPLYYSLSEVVVPTYSINQAAEGSVLREDLQTAWDFSTGHTQVQNGNATIINQTGFWKVELSGALQIPTSGTQKITVQITDGLSSKIIFRLETLAVAASAEGEVFANRDFVVFTKSGESVVVSASNDTLADVSYRQIATVNGILVNPLGFSAA
tara:strand:+ start:515 stop:1051 length:537 start_codon:yes stop_codon:yes gene_type:complete